MKVNNFEELFVWQKAIDLMGQVFEEFNTCDSFWYMNQVFRASCSISANIAEGFERKSNKEFARFLYISRGSCAEVRSLIHVGVKCKLLTEERALTFIDETKSISFLIYKLIQSLTI